MNCYCSHITIPRGVLEKTNEKSLDILYNLCIKNNLFVRAYKLYPKYRREEDMTDNGKPKYFSLMEQLRSDIMSGAIRPGEKLPSENELSQKYSLSRHTVRKALGILEQDGYVEAFHGRGTYCSENMRHIKNSKNIAVVTTYISDYIFPRLIQGMDNVLSESGYSIILKNTANSRQKEARCLEELLKKDIDGLIIEPSKSEMICKHRNLYQNLDKFEIPYVFIQGIYSEMRDKPHILMDDAQGGYLVTKYLLELGHKKIKGFFKADDMQGLERHKGYVKALQESGIAYDPDDVVWFHTEDRKVKPALMAKEMVQSGQLPDGIVCYNDQIAVQVMEELEKMGDICLKHNVVIMDDEIHCDFTYPGFKFTSFMTLDEKYHNSLVLYTSPSKTFNVAGLQPANIIIKNPELRAAYRKANAAAGYSQGSIMGQVAVKSVYTKGDEWVNELVEYITGNMNYMRDFVKENFPKAHFVDPEGTYLTWVDFSGYGFTDEELEHIMVEEAHLWLDSGKVFGPATAQFERFNLACPRATV